MSHWAAGILPGKGAASLEMPAREQGQRGSSESPSALVRTECSNVQWDTMVRSGLYIPTWK